MHHSKQIIINLVIFDLFLCIICQTEKDKKTGHFVESKMALAANSSNDHQITVKPDIVQYQSTEQEIYHRRTTIKPKMITTIITVVLPITRRKRRKTGKRGQEVVINVKVDSTRKNKNKNRIRRPINRRRPTTLFERLQSVLYARRRRYTTLFSGLFQSQDRLRVLQNQRRRVHNRKPMESEAEHDDSED